MSKEIHKVSLLIRNEDASAFLVCGKHPKPGDTAKFIMPGGKIEPGETEEECAHREIREELGCGIVPDSLQFVSEYQTVAAGRPDTTLFSRVYLAALDDVPQPQQEIAKVAWLTAEDLQNPEVTDTIREHIMPDLIERGLLKG
jgi:8-oxo-dGTP diphosphatase